MTCPNNWTKRSIERSWYAVSPHFGLISSTNNVLVLVVLLHSALSSRVKHPWNPIVTTCRKHQQLAMNQLVSTQDVASRKTETTWSRSVLGPQTRTTIGQKNFSCRQQIDHLVDLETVVGCFPVSTRWSICFFGGVRNKMRVESINKNISTFWWQNVDDEKLKRPRPLGTCRLGHGKSFRLLLDESSREPLEKRWTVNKSVIYCRVLRQLQSPSRLCLFSMTIARAGHQ